MDDTISCTKNMQQIKVNEKRTQFIQAKTIVLKVNTPWEVIFASTLLWL